MALGHSPSIVTNGLVFAYDDANIKSYKGPVLQNIANSTWGGTGNGTATGYSSTVLTETVDIPGLGATTVYSNIIQNNYTLYTPNSTNCCPSLHYWGNFAVSPSTLYTYAIVYKCDSGYTNSNYMYRYEYTANGGTFVTEGGVHNNANRVHLGNGWYYAWGTFTTQATTNWIGHAGTFYYRYSQSADKLSIAKVMIVAGNYAGMHPKYWPRNGTSRTNTQALVDLTNNNTITATSLTYASDGTFSFNGSSNTIDCGNASAISSITGTSNVAVEAWVKYTSYTGGAQAYSVITHKGVPWAWLMENPSNTARIRFSLSVSGDVACPDTTTHALNTWYQFVGTYDGTNMKFYRNGELKNTVAGSGTLGGSGLNMVVGSYSGGYFMNGSIATLKVYNRALTANEVKQNFNALRGRYGI